MQKIKELSIDLETYSDMDIKKGGVYRYSESPAFEILLFAVSVNNEPVVVYDLACGDTLPDEIINALVDDTVIKWAFNASFERICLSNWLRKHYPDRFISYSINEDTVTHYLDPTSWRCTMIWSAYMGLPLSLESVGKVLGLEEQKMKEGKDLIRFFCIPCKPTKTNGGRTRNLPSHAQDKWTTFKSYNQRDVVVEMGINDRGIAIDMQLVEHAIAFDEQSKNEISEQMKDMTNIDNPNSVVQMKQWLSDNGLETDTLDKKTVNEMIKTAPDDLTQVLSLRQQLAKSSVKKYQAMQNAVCDDGRARGMFQFYGGNRTGRWAGRIIQLQNLPQNHMPDLAQARQLVHDGDYDMLETLYENIPDTLSQLIRTAFIPKPGYLFYVADFSAIDARVLSFLAGETWRIDTFKNNKDIYCESASQMFHVPVEKHGVNGHLRQKGKIAELALGYGGSTGALKAMGALDMCLSEDELQPLVDAWRSSNPHIVQFRWNVDNAVKATIKQHIQTETHGIKFMYKSGMLFIHLPSGRNLSYVKPRIGENKFSGESVTYEGVGATKKWERIESYGPKFVENIVQAISRDLLCNSIKTLSHYFICGHVHDKIIVECKKEVSLEVLCKQMGRVPDWFEGNLLRADGYTTPFYKKD